MTSEQTLQILLAGNQRFVAGTALKPNQDKKRREEIAAGQHPIAIIVTCSDSRLCPEIIFDQGLGDIFVIRTAGQVLDNAALASIEYAAEHLHVPLLIVLGHKNCGAIKAAVEGGDLPGHLSSLTTAIKSAMEQDRAQVGDLMDNAVKANVGNVVNQLKNSEPILADLVKNNKLAVVGAYYDLESGIVSLLD